ncbi:MAG: hypothetical protein ACRDIC_05570 [bacterium]
MVVAAPSPKTPQPAPARHVYGVKFVCGTQGDSKCGDDPVAPGRYATEINIHNATEQEARIAKHVIPLVLAGAPRGREPRHGGREAEETILLPPHTATMDAAGGWPSYFWAVPPPRRFP